jgi:endoglucanase
MSSKYSRLSFLYRLTIIGLIALTTVQKTFSQQTAAVVDVPIRLNQIGFYPDWPKIAVVSNKSGGDFYIEDAQKNVLFKGTLTKSLNPSFAGKPTWIADFSNFHTPGKYVIHVNGIGFSYHFTVKDAVHNEVAAGALKAYYFMRASIPLKEKYAGKWARVEGHPDTVVLIHASAANKTRPIGMRISSPGGWYDAGDYNKYIVNSGISTSTLLSLYEDFPEYMKTVDLNIPESGNHVPDVLNEVLWNLRWMLTMQDPADGGVYHKLTNAAFDKFEMPDQAKEPRYVVQKGTAATLDFAAVMAQASRIFGKFKMELPGLSDSCSSAAKKAWLWAAKNPAVIYNQDEMNKSFSPQITTGAYGDKNVSDEFIWAASELFITTQDEKYLTGINLLPDEKMPVPNWGQVRLLGYYTLIKNEYSLINPPKELPEIKKRLLTLANEMIDGANETAYQTVMGKSAGNFEWGSNSVAANQGIVLIHAYKLSQNKKYLEYALSNLDYILGRNATGYSYVTGFGSKTPMHPHHRPSVADGIVDPIPGLLVGGPNPGMQDHIKVPSTVPDEAYIDDDRAYAVNEIAINWNAPFAYLVNAMEALQKK